MEQEETGGSRLAILQVICIVAVVVYAFRLFSIQILEGDVYRSRAQSITRRTTVIPAQRGEIFDRNYGLPLVMNTDSFAVNVTPGEVPRGEMPELIRRLAGILELSQDQIERKLPPEIHYLYQPVEVAVNISFNTIAILAEQAN